MNQEASVSVRGTPLPEKVPYPGRLVAEMTKRLVQDLAASTEKVLLAVVIILGGVTTGTTPSAVQIQIVRRSAARLRLRRRRRVLTAMP